MQFKVSTRLSTDPINVTTNRRRQIPIMKLDIFLDRAPASNPLSTSNIGIHVEPLTHAFKNKNCVHQREMIQWFK